MRDRFANQPTFAKGSGGRYTDRVLADLAGMELGDLETFVESLGHKRFHAKQIYRWIWRRGVIDFAQMSDLSQGLRTALIDKATVSLPTITKRDVSQDGTQKFVLQLADGKQIEAVFIPEDDRGTLCVSSQAGCAVGCRFALRGTKALVVT